MNKARRAVSVTARRLAAQGWTVMVVDLFGCGDSAGDFADASWELWLDDVVAAHQWLADRTDTRPVLWGLRLGALVATQALSRFRTSPDLLLWQPVISGSSHLQQFLRIRVVGERVGESGRAVSTAAFRDTLASGQSVEIAGYTLSPELALPMAAAEIGIPNSYEGRVTWCEIGTAGERPALGPLAAKTIAHWRERGVLVEADAVAGPMFWQTQEIEECPALQSWTIHQMSKGT